MAAVDAQFYWMSAKVPNDEFLLYAFDGVPADLGPAIAQVCRRARACPDLSTRVHDGCSLTYPQWVPAAVGPDQVVHHDLADRTWPGCLMAVVGLAGDQLDIRRMPWRLHVFTPVLGIPGVSGPGTVAVMQVAHALADGARASALAAWLFGRAAPVPEVKRIPPEQQTARLMTERRAKGKLVTVIAGLDPAGNDLTELATLLKNACGAGGTMKEGQIELQGDHLQAVERALQAIGYKTKADKS